MEKIYFLFKKESVLFNFLTAVLFVSILYRATFLYDFLKSPFIASCLPLAASCYITLGIFHDLIFLFTLFILFFLMGGMIKNTPQKSLLIFKKTFFYSFYFLISIFYIFHKKFFITFYKLPDFSILEQIPYYNYTLIDYLKMGDIEDYTLLIFSILIITAINYLPKSAIKKLISHALLPLIGLGIAYGTICSFYFSINLVKSKKGDNILYVNPIIYLTKSGLNSHYSKYLHTIQKPDETQINSISLNNPIFIGPEDTPPFLSFPDSKKKWNVLFIVLESTGAVYLDTSNNHKTPMPFIDTLKKQGLFLNNHFSAGNCSHLGLFSIFSGLYPDPKNLHFELQKNIFIPNLSAWLGKDYTGLFVTAGNLSNFCPYGFLMNTGSLEIYDKSSIKNLKNSKEKSYFYLDEIETVDFFLSKLENTKSPFFAVYYSGAAHFPYFDYGKEYQLISTLNSPIASYINNLYLLDFQIKKIFDFLKNKKLLEDTIVMITGDHGEGFNQHNEGQKHGTTLYQEQIKVPALFYQPEIFKPKTINQATSSIDILPTILDALALPYDKQLFQGNSLFRAHKKRKYIFIINELGELASIDETGTKMIISLSEDTCKTYDLKQDPFEKTPLPCNNKSQEEAIVQFGYHQPLMLEKYNNLQKEKRFKKRYHTTN